MLQRLIAVLVMAALSSLGLADPPARVITSEKELEKAQTEDATRAALDRKIPSVKFTEVKLIDAIDFLRDVSGANIHVDWRALERAGIDRNTTLNFHVKDITLAKALSMTLRDASGDDNLAWMFDRGVIEIGLAENFDRVLYIGTYDVRELVGTKDDELAKELVELITEVISPSTWVQNGGRSTIRYFNGKLVITTGEEAHDAISKLLKALGDFRKAGETAGGKPASGTTAASSLPGAKH
jgi:hypothetical protein